MRGRCLRSKRLRALLWYAADGKCQGCGIDLPEHWHADHIVPYVVSKRTNIHEMQALCPACNLRKGISFMKLREHQSEFVDIMRRIRTGEPIRKIIVHVTPGGGKSALPVIAASELIRGGLADKLCWVAPRLSLVEQAEDSFLDPAWRLTLNHRYTIRASTNDLDPSRGTAGYATTKAALVQDSSGINAQEFERFRYILVIDEAHHVSADEDGGYYKAIRPLLDRAAFVILMTGTLERHKANGDLGRIAEIPYRDDPGGAKPDFDNLPPDTISISYGREQALHEHAIVPLHVVYHDAHAAWIDPDGDMVERTSFDLARDLSGAMRRAVLKTEFAFSLIDEAIDHWLRHRSQVYGKSKMIVVAPDQKTAKTYIAHILKRGIKAALAISNDGKEAQEAIKRFRKSDGKDKGTNCLVTVAMAYEGLDDKRITHICCLTDYRSRPWIEQMIARATRFNPDPAAGPWEGQWAYLFSPDDGDMRKILIRIKAEEIRAIGSRQPEPMISATGVGEGGMPPLFELTPGDIVPVGSRFTQARATDLDGSEQASYAEHAWLKQQLDAHNLGGTTTGLKSLLNSLGVAIPKLDVTIEQTSLLVTDSEEEKRLREAIQARCNWADNHLFERAFGKANGIVLAEFKKPRDQMTLPELRKCWAFVSRRFHKEMAS